MGDKTLTREEAAKLAGVSANELKGRERTPRSHDAFSEAIHRTRPTGATPEDPSGISAEIARVRQEIMSGPGGKTRAENDIASGGASRAALEHHVPKAAEPGTP